jgi:hypothetical protein
MKSARYSRKILKIIFSTDFRKIFKTSNRTKIRPVGAELFHAYGKTAGHDKIIPHSLPIHVAILYISYIFQKTQRLSPYTA